MTLKIARTRDGVPFARLLEFYGQHVAAKPISADSIEIVAMIEEIVEAREGVWEATLQGEIANLRADRVKLQGEIERLTHELAEAHATRPLPPSPRYGTDPDRLVAIVSEQHGRVAIDIEALAQRLAKVEDRLAADAIALNRHGLSLHHAEHTMGDRIDQVCEIIGERIGGLEERLNANVENVTYDRKRVDEITGRDLPGISEALAEIRRLTLTPSVPFPTGAGTTVEDAIAQAEAEAWTAAAVAQVEEPGAESEPLKPQRGDRVRLEGARAYFGHDTLPEGWYNVIGHDVGLGIFQVEAAAGALRWVEGGTGLKEVRRGAANLPE